MVCWDTCSVSWHTCAPCAGTHVCWHTDEACWNTLACPGTHEGRAGTRACRDTRMACWYTVHACPGTQVSQDTVHVSQYGVRASRDAEACPGTGLCQQRVRVSQEARVPGRVGGVPVQCEGVPGRGHVCWDTGVPKIWSVSRDTSCPRTRFGVPGHDKPTVMVGVAQS